MESATSLYHAREVTIRGFIYQSADQRWILASEPNLKTCCVGSMHKIWQQIIVEGEFESFPSNQVVKLAGKLQVDPVWDNKQSLKQVFRLENAQIVQEYHHYNWLLLSGLAIGLLALAFFALRLNHRKILK